MNLTRRILLTSVVATGAAWSIDVRAQAKLDERDPQAVTLGYVDDASRADVKKFPKYAAGQSCASCSLYQGAAGSATGPCPLFVGKQVSAKGWCSAWVKKG